jgi:two-component system sensor histidine kinase UhpB
MHHLGRASPEMPSTKPAPERSPAAARYARMTKAELVRIVQEQQNRQNRDLARLQEAERQLRAQNQQLQEGQRLLSESRDRYAMLYEFSPVGYFSMDESGTIRVINLTAATILGGERSQLVGKPLAPHIDETDVPQFLSHISRCVAGEARVKTELRLRSAAQAKHIELISAPAIDPPSEGMLYRTAMMDITDRKCALDALDESEAKLRWLIDNMPAVLWIKDQRGSARYVSPNVKRILGYEPHELRSGGAQFWFSNVHPDDRDRVRRAYSGLFEDGNAGGASAYDIEYRHQSRDGSWVWVVDRGMSVAEDKGTRYATGMFWDTTRRKRIQEQLRESEERFRQLAENINDVFFLTDVDGKQIFYVSPTFEKVWGFSTQALYRDPPSWLDLVHEIDRERVRRAIRLRKPGTRYDMEFRVRRPTGAVRWVRLRGFPIREETGQVYRFAGIAVDVTARKEAAELLQRSHERMRELALHLESVREDERKRIAREIHDELGALLLAIKMDVESLRRAPRAVRAARRASVDELTRRIDMAIDAVRRIATDLRPSILDNLGVLAAVEWQAQDLERRTGICCEVETDSGKEEIDVDAERATAIFRIVQEALANIVRHSEAKRVKIALHERGGIVEVRITDDGKGMEALGPTDYRRWGLVGMAERVSRFKGKFGIAPARPHGTTLSVSIPARTPPKAGARAL